MSDDRTISFFIKKCDEIKSILPGRMKQHIEIATTMESIGESNYVSELEESLKQYIILESKLQHYITSMSSIQSQMIPSFGSVDDHDFEYVELFNSKVAEFKDNAIDYTSNEMYKDFRRKVWQVNHPDEMLPEDEEEELIFDDSNVEVVKCPLSRTDITDPYRNKTCGHVFNKDAIFEYIKQKKRISNRVECPCAGCRGFITKDSLVEDKEYAQTLKKKRKRDERDKENIVDL